ncbi:class I SAM-dependent methyltransferase [Treponema pectinovorum]|uniref:class I SAM-dependent methyltransferase n=1 Tax=Treponema pectinovorum TaxID=164 RepID=UPI0011CCA334|nr:methyltransferase domain-containing protein [Treponema pectinovorum]
MEINQHIAEYYDELYPVTEEQKVFYEKVINQYETPVKFLRIGCGTGTFEHNLAREGSDVTGIETSQELLDSANRKRRTQLMSVRYFQMSYLEMTRFLGRGFYNVISILHDRILFIHDKTLLKKFFYDCRQLVSQNGKLILSFPNFHQYVDSNFSEKIELPSKKSIRAHLQTFVTSNGENFFMEQSLYNGTKEKIEVTKDAPIYLLQWEEVEQFAKEAGFFKVEFYQDFSLKEFTDTSPRVLAVISA